MAIDFTIKEISADDLGKDFYDTLGALKPVGDLEIEDAKSILSNIQDRDGHIFIAVTPTGNIIGTTTVLIEQKFIHTGGRCGHVEDVAVHSEAQGNGIGKALVKHCVEYAKERGCYKVILDCNDENKAFYESIGFKHEDNSMKIRF